MNTGKGEDYMLSHITTLDKVETTSHPWVYSYFYQKILEISVIKSLMNVYKNNGSFFMLLLWTGSVHVLIAYLMLPETVFLLFNSMLQVLAGFVAPCLVCFMVYLWTGLILKLNKLIFSIRVCFVSCIILEVVIELFVNTGFSSSAKSLITGVTLSFIVVSTGFCFMEKKFLTVSGIISSIIMLRFVLVENMASISYRHALPPLLAYICTIAGLSISTLPTIQIPRFNERSTLSRSLSPMEMSTIPIIRQRRASSIEIPTVNHNGVSHAQKTRRKSLPALGVMPSRKVSMSMDLSILGEAHGMISDLLADSTLPMNVTGTLRIVADMISPLLQHSFQHNQVLPPNQLLTVFEKHIQEDERQVLNQPDLKDDTPLSLKQRLQRNLGVSSRRMSSSYTTTTSATGMPTIDLEYHAKKNSSPSTNVSKLKPVPKRNSRSKSYAGSSFSAASSEKLKAFANKSHSFSQSISPSSSPRNSCEDDIFKVEITRGKPIFFEGMDTDCEESDQGTGNTDTDVQRTNTEQSEINHVDNTFESNRHTLSSLSEQGEETFDKEVADAISKSDSISKPAISMDAVKEQTSVSNIKSDTEASTLSTFRDDITQGKPSEVAQTRGSAPPLKQREANPNVAQVAPVQKSSAQDSNSENSTELHRESLTVPANNSNRRRSSRELHLEYEMAVSQEVNGLLIKLNEWDFPIFELSEKCNILTQLAFRIFQVCGFFNTFKIPEVTFLKYFRALESGYHNIPYHNRIHAADVLHGVYYFTQHKIPGFNPNSTSRRSSINQDDDQQDTDDVEESTYGAIAESMPELELMALYTAAAMHDFDHPGRTNAFLVATLNPKALLYNDRSVLENHHAAASWSLLATNPGLNFLSSLDPVDFKRFRFIVIEEILSTDLKKHFDFLTEWNAKVSDQGPQLNFESEADRLLVGQMTIKLADISGPTKEWNLHRRWTDRIIEEFYQQGEDEKTLGMPLSAYMDRNDPKVPQLQASFIKHLVSPLYMAYEKASLMPGEWTDVSEDEDGDNDEEHSSNDASDLENSDSEKEIPKKKKIAYSIVIDNIQKNHEKWLKIIEEEEQTSKNEDGEQETASNEDGVEIYDNGENST